jgi:hypothetical protein
MVRRSRRGNLPISFQDEGLSGTQLFAIRYWANLQFNTKQSNEIDWFKLHSDLSSAHCFVSPSDSEPLFKEEEDGAWPDEDGECIWMIIQDDDSKEYEDDLRRIQGRHRQQEQHPGRSDGGSSHFSAQVTTNALPTLVPLCHSAYGGSWGHSSHVQSSAFRDLERNTRMRQPASMVAVDGVANNVTNAADHGNSTETMDRSVGKATTTTDITSYAPHDSDLPRSQPRQSQTSTSVGTVVPSASDPPAASPTPTAFEPVASTGDFFSPQALTMRQARPGEYHVVQK